MSDNTNILAQSDEDFLKDGNQFVLEREDTDTEETNETETVDPPGSEDEHSDEDDPAPPEESSEEDEEDSVVPSIKPAGSDNESEPEEHTKEETHQVNHAEFYERLTKPFKANGKMLVFDDPDEIIKLMQQGANYTQKLQQLAPMRRIAATLEKHGLLDEEKINYLIDLSKQNKGAITKLVKDAKIDPLDMNLEEEEETPYKPENYQVSEQELRFNEVLDELKETPGGVEVIQMIHRTWDDRSKDALWEQPESFHVIHEQKQSGLYDYVVSEIERARLLGKVAPNAPFLAVYRDASEELYKQGRLNRFLKPENQYNPKPVAKTVQKKPSVGNHSKASAATNTARTNRTANAMPNPLSMSDEEFLKLMAQNV